jgi:hypothetical protein
MRLKCNTGKPFIRSAGNIPHKQTTNPGIKITVAYTLGIYLLNLFLAFLTPKFDPSLTQDEGLEDGDAGSPSLPTKKDEEFRPFIRRLPEFKFWHSATRAIAIGFVCSWLAVFDIPVFWPVLVVYWIILFVLTSMCSPFWSEADTTSVSFLRACV